MQSADLFRDEKKKMKKRQKNGSGKRYPKRIWSFITTVLTTVFVIGAFLLIGVRVLGFEPYVVLSGSMTPKYPVGSLVYVEKTDPNEIEPGKVITYVFDESVTVVTHRVVEVDRENRCFYTKGDANQDRDGKSVSYENVIGVVKFSIPYLGYVSHYLKSPVGRVNMIVLCILMGVSIFLSSSEEKEPKKGSRRKGR